MSEVDVDRIRSEILNVIKQLGNFTIDDLKEKLVRIDGDEDLIKNIAEHVLLTHPNISNYCGLFTWNEKPRF